MTDSSTASSRLQLCGAEQKTLLAAPNPLGSMGRAHTLLAYSAQQRPAHNSGHNSGQPVAWQATCCHISSEQVTALMPVCGALWLCTTYCEQPAPHLSLFVASSAEDDPLPRASSGLLMHLLRTREDT